MRLGLLVVATSSWSLTASAGGRFVVPGSWWRCWWQSLSPSDDTGVVVDVIDTKSCSNYLLQEKWPQEECIVRQPAEADECESTVMCDTNCVVVIIGLSFDWGWLRPPSSLGEAVAGVIVAFLSDRM